LTGARVCRKVVVERGTRRPREVRMSNKKNKGGSGKIIAKREAPAIVAPKKAAPAEPAEKSRVPERIHEKDAGFGAVKVVAGIIIALIVGVSILGRFFGGNDEGRGSAVQDELCGNTEECKAGYICQAYGSDPDRCLRVCELKNSQSCGMDHQCVPLAKQAGRKKMRLVDVCVPNAKVQ
jgi:hypothetical protein